MAAELFGYEKGAFTGGNQRHAGRFEVANHGSMFFDEIGDMPGRTQVALFAGASGTRVRARRGALKAFRLMSLPCNRSYKLRSAIGSSFREVSSGPVLSIKRFPDPRSSSTRPARGYSYSRRKYFIERYATKAAKSDQTSRKADHGASRGEYDLARETSVNYRT